MHLQTFWPSLEGKQKANFSGVADLHTMLEFSSASVHSPALCRSSLPRAQGHLALSKGSCIW